MAEAVEANRRGEAGKGHDAIPPRLFWGGACSVCGREDATSDHTGLCFDCETTAALARRRENSA